MKERRIYKLELHESLPLQYWEVTRVPGGWIYRTWVQHNQDWSITGIFVPFNNEFQKP